MLVGHREHSYLRHLLIFRWERNVRYLRRTCLRADKGLPIELAQSDSFYLQWSLGSAERRVDRQNTRLVRRKHADVSSTCSRKLLLHHFFPVKRNHRYFFVRVVVLYLSLKRNAHLRKTGLVWVIVRRKGLGFRHIFEVTALLRRACRAVRWLHQRRILDTSGRLRNVSE